MDIEEGLKSLLHRDENNFQLSEGTYGDDLYQIQNEPYFLISYSNMVVVYDLNLKIAQVLYIGKEGN